MFPSLIDCQWPEGIPLANATECLFRPWYHLQAYTKTVIKLCGIDHHFVEAGTAMVKLHNEAGARMFQSMAGFKDTTMPNSFVFTPLQALFGSMTENTTRQQFVPSLICLLLLRPFEHVYFKADCRYNRARSVVCDEAPKYS